MHRADRTFDAIRVQTDSPDFVSFVALLSTLEHLHLLHLKQSGPEEKTKYKLMIAPHFLKSFLVILVAYHFINNVHVT